MALQWHTQAHAVYETLKPSIAALNNLACVALCQIRLDQPDAALSMVNPPLLDRLNAEWAQAASSRDDHPALDLSAGAGGAG